MWTWLVIYWLNIYTVGVDPVGGVGAEAEGLDGTGATQTKELYYYYTDELY